jgi:hypothetical protein
MRRWAGIAGILFVVLAIASTLVQGDVPDTNAQDATRKFAEFYSDDDNQSKALASAALGMLGQFAFLWFLGGLWSTLRSRAAATTTATMVLVVGGAGFFALGMVEHLVGNVVGIALNFAEEGGYELDPGLAILMNDLATGAFLAAMMAVGGAALAGGLLIRQTRALPGWLLWVAVAIVVLTLPAIPPLSFVAAILLAVWVVVISVVMIQSNEPEVASAEVT